MMLAALKDASPPEVQEKALARVVEALGAGRGDEAAVLAWLDCGGRINATCEEGEMSGVTVLMLAAMYGHDDVARLIETYKPPAPRPPTPQAPAPAPADVLADRPKTASEAAAPRTVSAKPDLGLPELDVAKAKAGVRVFDRLPQM